MKSSRLIAIGSILLLAGVIGFASGFSHTREGQPGVNPTDPAQAAGFLPVFFPDGHAPGAPTLPPTEIQPLSPADQATSIPAVQPTPAGAIPPAGPLIPDRIVIPKIDLDAPVVEATGKKIKAGAQEFLQFLAPDEFAAGWHTNSAPLGEAGNTVLNGHHNAYGKVFGRLVELAPGDRIIVYSGTTVFDFQIANILILPERDADMATRLENARWIGPSDDVRLTLITCWPAYSNTHRLIIVASLAPESWTQSAPH